MRIMNVKRAIIIFLMIGIMVIMSGCARWPEGPEPGPGETEYQLEITVEVKGQINSYEGIYYIVMDADGKPATGPREDISLWDDRFYYIKLEGGSFYFTRVEEGSASISLTDSSYSEDKLQVTIALNDLIEDPNSIDINVVTTDSEGNNYDHLDNYFTINIQLYSTGEGGPSTDLEEDKADFDIVKVTAIITTLY
jgi:hypothetical protein